MDWARRSARSGSVAASAPATSASAKAFRPSSVMDWARRSARSGSVAASAFATMASATGLPVVVGDGLDDTFRVGEEPGAAGSVAASAFATAASAMAFPSSSVMDWAIRSASARSRARSWVGGCQCPRDVGERDGLQAVVGDGLGECVPRGPGRWLPVPPRCRRARGLQAVVGDGLGEAFRAVRVGGCQCPRDVGERTGLHAVAR